MKLHRECAVICGGGTDPPPLQVGIQKKKKIAAQSIPVAQSCLSSYFPSPSHPLVHRFRGVIGDVSLAPH